MKNCHCGEPGNAGVSVDQPKKKCGNHRCLKFIGYLIIILSLLGMICTAVGYACYLTKYGYNPEFYPAYRTKVVVPNEQGVMPEHKMVPETVNP